MSKGGIGFAGAVVLLLSSHASAQIASATDVTQAEYLAGQECARGRGRPSGQGGRHRQIERGGWHPAS